MVLFYGPLYLEVTCSSCLPEEYRVASFPGDDSRNGFRFLMVQTAENCGVSAVAVHDGRRYFCRGAEGVSHGLAVQQTTEILLLILNTVIDVPVAQVVQVPSYMAVTCTEFACGVPDYGRFSNIISGWLPYSANTGYMFTSVYGGRALLPCRDAEACPMVQIVCRSLFAGRAGFPVVAQWLVPWSRLLGPS